MKPKTCATCRWWSDLPREIGFCKSKPALFRVLVQDDAFLTRMDFGCIFHEPKPKKAKP